MDQVALGQGDGVTFQDDDVSPLASPGTSVYGDMEEEDNQATPPAKAPPVGAGAKETKMEEAYMTVPEKHHAELKKPAPPQSPLRSCSYMTALIKFSGYADDFERCLCV